MIRYAIQERRTKKWWTELGTTTANLEDPDLKLFRHKMAASAVARIMGRTNARTNELYSSSLPEAYDVVPLRGDWVPVP